MDPFGFAHLQNRKITDTTLKLSNKNHGESSALSRMTKLKNSLLHRLYYPVNTPVCHYQRSLILDSLCNNTLIALPKELDAFFVAAVTMLNFRRWFPAHKVVCICTNLESSVNVSKRFVEITGYSQEICIYTKLKKCDRYRRWVNDSVIFATAESLVSDIKDGETLSELCLMVIEDAHRAITGSHPVSELIRNCLFAKANFRILAYTDCKIDKIGQLQLIVMNLQINLIRSLSSVKEDVSLAIASPRMQKLYVVVDEDIRRVGKEVLKVLRPLATLLYESGVFPTFELKKLGNFSTGYMQKMLENKGNHLKEIYHDFFNFFAAYDILMCEGITAFVNKLQEEASRSAALMKIIKSNLILKEACFHSLVSRPYDLQCHKLEALVTLLKKIQKSFDCQKATVVVLCRDRDSVFVDSLLTTMKARLNKDKCEFAFFLHKNDTKDQSGILKHMLREGKCNVVIVPCGFEAVEINIGYVDSLICMDEGLSSVHYTSAIKVGMEGSLFALCSAGYETNIYSFLTAGGTIDCIQMECIKGVQPCNDVKCMFPSSQILEIVEYWAEKFDDNSGLLTTVERMDFEERLAFDSPLDKSKLIKKNRDLLNFCVKENFLWQDRPQRFTIFGHSTTTLMVTGVLCKNRKLLEEQMQRLGKSNQTLIWLDEDLLPSKKDDTYSIEPDSEVSRNLHESDPDKRTRQKRPAKMPTEKEGTRKKMPRTSRIESANSTLLKMMKPQITGNDFVNRIEELDDYRERQKQMAEIIRKLNHLVRL